MRRFIKFVMWFLSTVVFLCLWMGVCFLPVRNAWPETYETLKKRLAKDVLSSEILQNTQYTIDPEVRLEGYTNIYTVTSEFGKFTAHGDIMLRRLVREIAAIEDLKQQGNVKAIAEAAGESAIGPFKATADLITEPKKTLQGIPKGVNRLFESGIKSFQRDRTEYEDTDFAALMAVSSYKREYAREHNVDVYSSNPILQKELDRIGWISVPGYISVSLALPPIQNRPGIFVYKTMNILDFLNEVIEESAPADLHIMNEAKLKEMGIPDAIVKKFLGHPVYSPRHQTIITFCLEKLADAENRRLFFKTALNALNEEEAFFYQQIAELFQAYDNKETRIIAIKRFNKIPVGITGNNSVFLAVPFDYGIWTPHAENAFEDLKQAFSTETKGGQIIVWITGSLSEKTREQLTDKQILFREEVDNFVALMD